MTIHASKGLEFSAVWIVGMEENLFPIAPREGEEPNLEEERRLMYVAITRAKKRLFFSHCKQRRKFGEEQVQLRSRFLDEVDAGVVRTESGATIRQKQGSFGHGSGFGRRVDGISGGLRGGMNGHAGSGGYGMSSAGVFRRLRAGRHRQRSRLEKPTSQQASRNKPIPIKTNRIRPRARGICALCGGGRGHAYEVWERKNYPA